MLTTILNRLKCKRGAMATVDMVVWTGIICAILIYVTPKMNTGVQDVWLKTSLRIESLDTILKP